MKIMFFSDVHLGNNRFPIKPWIINAMDQVVQIARDERPNLILFGGDAFRSRVPPTGAIARFGKMLYWLAEIAPVYTIAGNHDIVGDGTALDVYKYMRNVEVFAEPHTVTYDDVRIVCMPWLPRRALIGGESTYKQVEFILDMVAPNNNEQHNLLLAHCTALGAKFHDEVSTLVGGDVVWPTSWLERYDMSFLGHIHKHQSVGGSGVYSGSICPISFAEKDQEKNVVLWHDGKAYVRSLDTPIFRQVSAKDLPTQVGKDDFLQIVKEHDEPDPKDVPECAWYEIVSKPPRRQRRQRLDTHEPISRYDAITKWLELAGHEKEKEKILALIRKLETGD